MRDLYEDLADVIDEELLDRDPEPDELDEDGSTAAERARAVAAGERCRFCGFDWICGDGNAVFCLDIFRCEGDQFIVLRPCCEELRDAVAFEYRLDGRGNEVPTYEGWRDVFGRTLEETVTELFGWEALAIDAEGTIRCALRVEAPGELRGRSDSPGGVTVESPAGWRDDLFAEVERHHRHHEAPIGYRFGAAIYNGPTRVGVAVAARPVSIDFIGAEATYLRGRYGFARALVGIVEHARNKVPVLTPGTLGNISTTEAPAAVPPNHDNEQETTNMARIDSTPTPAAPSLVPAPKAPVADTNKKPSSAKKGAAKPEPAKDAKTPAPEAEKPKTPEKAPPSSRGVAHRAAGGLQRSRTFLARQAERLVRWSDRPESAEAAEALRDSIADLDSAIKTLLKIPANYAPPSTPNTIGVGAKVELKPKELAKLAGLFPAAGSKVLEVLAVFDGGRLRCRLPTGDSMIFGRGQVNPAR